MLIYTYTDNHRNSTLDMRGIWTSKLEEEYVEGAPSMALVAVFSVYRVIQEDGLNFVSLYFKVRTSDKHDVNYI